MHSLRLRSLLIALAAVILVAGAAAAQHTGHSSPAPKGGSAQTMGSPSHEMHKHMMMGMQDMQKMKITGDVDVDFATMMTMHHKHGIEMARVQKESQQFKEWLAANPFKD